MGWAFLATYGVVLKGERREFDQLLASGPAEGQGTYGVRWFGCQTLVYVECWGWSGDRVEEEAMGGREGRATGGGRE